MCQLGLQIFPINYQSSCCQGRETGMCDKEIWPEMLSHSRHHSLNSIDYFMTLRSSSNMKKLGEERMERN